MPVTATYLVCYDVTLDRERDRVARVVQEFGLRLQFSVFECRLSRSALSTLRRRIEDLALTSGSVLICRLEERARRHQIGTPTSAEPLATAADHALLL